MATTKTKAAGGGGLVVLAILIALLAGQGGGGGGTPSTTRVASSSTSTSSSTTIVAAPTTTVATSAQAAVRFGAPGATWNQPAATFGLSTKYASYADRFWTSGAPAPPGSINLAFGDYSVPIYYAADATTLARVYQTTQAQALYGLSNVLKFGDPIPWNPSWRSGTGNDRLLIIVDQKTDRVWELGGAGYPSYNCIEPFGLGPNGRAGFDPTNPLHLCLYGVNRYEGAHTFTDGQTIVGRGAGINKLALITTPEEVQSGAILHALEMTIPGTMYGEPTCAEGSAGAGTSCGFYVKPATRVEWTVNSSTRCAPTPTPPRSATVPEGMRFVIDVTDAEISAWLDSRHYIGPARETARVFAVALRDYGWIVAETGCWGWSIELDGVQSPRGAALWAKLGVTDVPKASGMLTGLITKDRIRVIEPPR